MELDELFEIVEDALEGNSYAQLRLGDCFYNGVGVNVDYKNHAKHNVSNMHNINNIHNIYHFSNKGINGSKKNNYQYTDNNFNNNIQKYKRKKRYKKKFFK